MQLTISAPALRQALAHAAPLATSKTQPILGCIHLVAVDDGLLVESTNLDISISAKLPARFTTKGDICVPAKALVDAISRIDGDVTLRATDALGLEARSGRTKIRLHGLPGAEFPSLPTVAQSSHPVDPAHLADILGRCLPAASIDETRYNLCGVRVQSGPGGTAEYVATDGHRLHLIRDDVAIGRPGITIPIAGATALRKLLARSAGAVLGCTEEHLTAVIDGITMSMRLIDMPYPDVSQVIPRTAKTVAMVSRVDLSAALQRVSSMSGKLGSTKITINKTSMVLSSSSPEAGEIEDEVACESNGDATFALNAKLLVDALTAASDDATVAISVGDDKSPIKVEPVNGGSATCVVMPMRP
jgi:DNA polymerase-3 subunit beta